MTPRDLRNIHTTGNSCRDALPCANVALKLRFPFKTHTKFLHHLICIFAVTALEIHLSSWQLLRFLPWQTYLEKKEVEPVEPVLKNIYQSNTYRKDLSWPHFDDEPRVQENQQVKDQQSCISAFVACLTIESNSPDILALCETNLDDSIDSANISLTGYLPLIQKDSSTHVHGLAVYMKEGLPFAWDLSLENSADSYLCFRLALLHSVSYFFFLY